MENSSEKIQTPRSVGSPPLTLSSSPSASSPPLPLSPPGTAPVVVSPCAACKILRRRCTDKCVLAPYFPPTDPLKFTIAHKVFGASNIIKFLQEIPEKQRIDAVSSMVYEANVRLKDPVYGCAGAIWRLQKQVNEVQAELAKAQAEIVNLQSNQANLLTLLCMEIRPHQQQDSTSLSPPLPPPHQPSPPLYLDFYDDNNSALSSIWEPLWT